jgi:hypothetical protein
VDQLLEGRVRLDKVVYRKLEAKLGAQVLDPVRLVLATAVRQQDERDVVVLQVLQRLRRTGNRLGDVKENAIDAVIG